MKKTRKLDRMRLTPPTNRSKDIKEATFTYPCDCGCNPKKLTQVFYWSPKQLGLEIPGRLFSIAEKHFRSMYTLKHSLEDFDSSKILVNGLEIRNPKPFEPMKFGRGTKVMLEEVKEKIRIHSMK